MIKKRWQRRHSLHPLLPTAPCTPRDRPHACSESKPRDWSMLLPGRCYSPTYLSRGAARPEPCRNKEAVEEPLELPSPPAPPPDPPEEIPEHGCLVKSASVFKGSWETMPLIGCPSVRCPGARQSSGVHTSPTETIPEHVSILEKN